MPNLQYTHLLYVRKYSLFKNDYELFIYGVNTNDIYHTIGEYLTQSIEQVKRIDYAICTQEKINYWENNGYKIQSFKEKHKVNTERHAYWKPMNEHTAYCSHCKTILETDKLNFHRWKERNKFCRNCGCKMDKTNVL